MELKSIDISGILSAHEAKLEQRIKNHHTDIKNKVRTREGNYPLDYYDLVYFKN